jgi:Tat protein translocase TatB subunit
MDFLGIGLPEIILILIIAVIVVGPKRLPEIAVQIARAIRQLRGYATDITAEMRSELDELTREYEEVRKELQEFRRAAAKDVHAISREIDRAVREAPAIIESSAEPEPEKRPSPSGEETTRDDDS